MPSWTDCSDAMPLSFFPFCLWLEPLSLHAGWHVVKTTCTSRSWTSVARGFDTYDLPNIIKINQSKLVYNTHPTSSHGLNFNFVGWRNLNAPSFFDSFKGESSWLINFFLALVPRLQSAWVFACLLRGNLQNYRLQGTCICHSCQFGSFPSTFQPLIEGPTDLPLPRWHFHPKQAVKWMHMPPSHPAMDLKRLVTYYVSASLKYKTRFRLFMTWERFVSLHDAPEISLRRLVSLDLIVLLPLLMTRSSLKPLRLEFNYIHKLMCECVSDPTCQSVSPTKDWGIGD